MRKKTTKSIAALKGKILVFGGVYSNLQALNTLQVIANRLEIPATNIICTGDIVGYCAQAEECVQSVMQWGVHSIAGNVEIQLREGEEDCGCNFDEAGRCNILSRQWYPFAQSKLSRASIDWMQTLPDFLQFQYANRSALVLHGSYQETAEFIFASTPWAIKSKNFKESKADLILAGHCGLPFAQQQSNQYWLNAGVIGMPANDGTSRVWYMILEENGSEIQYQHHPFQYDHLTAARRMREAQLPLEYARTLTTGIWDNCEILPAEETLQQGKAI